MSDVTEDQARRHSGQFHAVRFYNDAEGLSRIVAKFLSEGLTCGQPAIVIATAAHLAAIETQLRKYAIDLDRLKTDGDVVLLDADVTLAAFMVDGMPNAGRFRKAVTPVIDVASRRHNNGPVRAYGEMVDVLWKAGQTVAAIRLETLWNILACTHEFSLVCGYSVGNFYKETAVDDICSQHSHVVSDSGQPAILH